MKVLLVNPPRSPCNALRDHAPEPVRRFVHTRLVGPPLGLLTVAVAAREVLRAFEPGRVLHINVLLHVTALCDCFGMGQPSIVPDVGIMVSPDVVAVEKATLDAIGRQPFFPEALPGGREEAEGRKHPFERAWGKDPYVQVVEASKLGMGSLKYRVRQWV